MTNGKWPMRNRPPASKPPPPPIVRLRGYVVASPPPPAAATIRAPRAPGKRRGSQSVSDDAKLGEVLIRENVITATQLKTAVDFQRKVGGELKDILVKLG